MGSNETDEPDITPDAIPNKVCIAHFLLLISFYSGEIVISQFF